MMLKELRQKKKKKKKKRMKFVQTDIVLRAKEPEDLREAGLGGLQLGHDGGGIVGSQLGASGSTGDARAYLVSARRETALKPSGSRDPRVSRSQTTGPCCWRQHQGFPKKQKGIEIGKRKREKKKKKKSEPGWQSGWDECRGSTPAPEESTTPQPSSAP